MTYQDRLQAHLIEYKRSVLAIAEPGIYRHRQVGIPKDHILPKSRQWSNLLDLAEPLVRAHLAANPTVRPHRYFHHLNSSQAFAFNLFFPYFGGESNASSALLRALGCGGELASWEPEAVPDPIEGTNLDARWALVDGTAVMCEVKLSENEFGRAESDAKHRKKFADIYRDRLIEHVENRLLDEATFFRAYQILRNVWHMLGVPGSKLIFLIPRANETLWAELNPTLATLTSEVRKRVSVVATEDVLTRLGGDTQCPTELRDYAARLARKYVI